MHCSMRQDSVSAVLFWVCIPSKEHESNMRDTGTPKHVFHDSLNESPTFEYVTDTTGHSARVLSTPIGKNFIRVDQSRSEDHLSKLRFNSESQITPKDETHTSTFQDISLETALKLILEKMNILTASWCLGENNYYQVIFSIDCDDCEEVLCQLASSGIGSYYHSAVSVTPCVFHYQGGGDDEVKEEILEWKDPEDKTTEMEWDKAISSLHARLTVAKVVQGVKSDADLTFDFLALLLIAAFLSALGLVENNPEILVASMLISPLMGPIMAGTFGTIIGDRYLQKLGFRNELLGLLISLIIGYLFGCVGFTGKWRDGWPTEEMILRGQLHSVWVGILIALFSGAAVAIATLGDYTGSLVGVAISTALLPPAVNAGLLWSLATVDLIREFTIAENSTLLNFNHVYVEYPPAELAILGAVSVCLTLVNILCIFLAGIIVLKIKEVAPRTSKEQRHFWKHDVKIARDYNQTIQGESARELQERLANEVSDFPSEESQIRFCRSKGSRWKLSQEVFGSATGVGLSQLTWSPNMNSLFPEEKSSTEDLDVACMTYYGKKLSTNKCFPKGSPSSVLQRAKSLSPKNVSGVTPRFLTVLPEDVGSYGSTGSTVPIVVQTSHKNKQRFVVTPAQDPLKL